jgi:hypothetical protein
MGWVFWLLCAVVVAALFWLVWRVTVRIEAEEFEERQWRELIARSDPQLAQQYQLMFNERFRLKK